MHINIFIYTKDSTTRHVYEDTYIQACAHKNLGKTVKFKSHMHTGLGLRV